jgi:excisionase family DNA binding protein
MEVVKEAPVRADKVAEFLGICRATVMNMARSGELPAHPVTNGGARKRWIFYISEVDAHMKRRRVDSAGSNPCAI